MSVRFACGQMTTSRQRRPWANLARLVVAVAAASVLVGCGTASPVDPAAGGIVARIERATVPERWSFHYQPNSPSPYLTCLSGIDEIAGVVDLDAGLVRLQPVRDAPAVLVTEDSVFVAATTDPETVWQEVTTASDAARDELKSVFGDVLADYVATGLRLPDPNTTVKAMLAIAVEVEPTRPRSGLNGDTLRITVDDDRYVAQLNADGVSDASRGDEPIPTVTVTVNEVGLVTALYVETTSTASEMSHGDGFRLTASYELVDESTASDPARTITTALTDLRYPTPSESCEFRS